ncbi:MAG: hypothetical protein ACOC8F_02370 [Planctomycetota bacterium]
MALTIVSTGAAVALLASGASGQIGRVNRGNALDANPLVGGGGRNVTRPGERRIDSQLYVTGQVTGLGRFRGDLGYRAANELRLDVPSAGLSTFRRQSVGIENVLSGAPYRSQPYFDPVDTTFELHSIARGAETGRRVAPSGGRGGVDERIYAEATRDYESLLDQTPRRGDTRLAGPYAPGGIRPAGDEPGAARAWRGEEEQDDEDVPPDGAVGLRDDRVETRVEGIVEPRATEGRELPPEAGQAPVQEGDDLPPEARPGRRMDVAPNQEVYLDMLRRQRELRTGRRAATGVRGAGADEAARTLGGPAPLVEIQDRTVVVRGLAGRSDDAFNAQMAEAERRLRQGEFYAAAEAAQTAMVMRPSSPLPRVGRAVALLAAGEPFAAAASLRQALELYPPLMETRMDLQRMMGDRVEVLRDRLGELEKRIGAEADTPAARRFAMLSAYLYQCLGQTEQARARAQRLAEADVEDKLLRAFARYVLTGERPGEGGATPAGGATTRPADEAGR